MTVKKWSEQIFMSFMGIAFFIGFYLAINADILLLSLICLTGSAVVLSGSVMVWKLTFEIWQLDRELKELKNGLK